MSVLEAAHFADRALQQVVTVVENVQIARDTFRVRFECPRIARMILPGQFLMLKLAGYDDPLLGRPLALYNTVLVDEVPKAIDVIYVVLGKMTRKLATFLPGQQLAVWGPLGNGFAPRVTDHLIMVAGGIGQTPMLALAQQYLGLRQFGANTQAIRRPERVTLCYGARKAEYLAGVEDFRTCGVDVRISTDDGSAGHHGLVTDLLQTALGESSGSSTHVVCCGPEPMMEAVSRITLQAGVSCQVSLETPMACGIGICFSCVAKVVGEDGEWDYRRTCVEGPVFDAQKIVW